MTHKLPCNIVAPKKQSARRKRATKLPSSNKHLGNHSGAKMEQKGGQSAAMSQRLHCPLHGSQAIISSPAHKTPSGISCWKGHHRPPTTAGNPQRVACLEPHSSLQIPSLLSQTQLFKGSKSRYVGVVTSGSKGRKAPIYRRKGGLSSLRPPRCVAHHGRS
jgi:hypothetical protein